MQKHNSANWDDEDEEFSPGFFAKDHSSAVSKHELGTVLTKSDYSLIISNTKNTAWQIHDNDKKKYLRHLEYGEKILHSWADYLPFSLRKELLNSYKRFISNLDDQGYWTKKKALFSLLALLTHFHHQREIRTPLSQLQLLAIKANSKPDIKPKDILLARKCLEKLKIITHVVKTPLLANNVFLRILSWRQHLNGVWPDELLDEAFSLSKKAVENGYYLKTKPKAAGITVLGTILVRLSSESVSKVCEKLLKNIPELSSIYDNPIEQLSRSIYRFRSRYGITKVPPEKLLFFFEKQSSR